MQQIFRFWCIITLEMEQDELPNTPKKELKNEKIPMREALEKIRDRVAFLRTQQGNVVVLVEGAWGTGKTTLVNALKGGVSEIPEGRIVAVDIDQETREIFGTDGNHRKKTLYEQAKREAGGKNLITALYSESNAPDILVIDGESVGRVLIEEVKIDRRNVFRINLCPDDSTRWNNLHNRGYETAKIIKVMRESPIKVDPECDFNVDNSFGHRLNIEEMGRILRGE